MGSWSQFFQNLHFFGLQINTPPPSRLARYEEKSLSSAVFASIICQLSASLFFHLSFFCAFFFFWFRLRIFSILLFCWQYPNLLSIPVLIDIFCVEYWNEINGDSSVALDDLDFQCVCVGGGSPASAIYTPLNPITQYRNTCKRNQTIWMIPSALKANLISHFFTMGQLSSLLSLILT